MKQLLVLCVILAGLCIMTMARPDRDFDVGNYFIRDISVNRISI
jgi:hypothetical protein